MASISFLLNGHPAEVPASSGSLLGLLRSQFGLVSVKNGCAPLGQCGSCTVLIDGRARLACKTDASSVRDKSITTVEGLSAAEAESYVMAFKAAGAVQCGFCTPGIVLRVKSVIDSGKVSTHGPIDLSKYLRPNLCRCTGYHSILQAMENLVTPSASVGLTDDEFVPRHDVEDTVLGRRRYVDDINVDGCLHGAFRLTDHARAKVVAMDLSRAKQLEGVVHIFREEDVPGTNLVGLIQSDWPLFVSPGSSTAHAGDVLAFVVARDESTARLAASLIDVSYEVMRPVTSVTEALAEPSTQVVVGLANLISTTAYSRGDVSSALENCVHVVTEEFNTQRVEHAFLEPESCLAVPQGGRLIVYSGGQGVADDRRQISQVLRVPPSEIRIVQVPNGGAFGGREDLVNQAHVALAAWSLKRPVKSTLARTESMLMHTKRHPMRLNATLGCDRDGKLKALRMEILGDAGPYASVSEKVLERAAGHATGAYSIPNVEVTAHAVRTNNPVSGAFRGFGANQVQFAIEGLVERLAERAGLDSWEMRFRNVVRTGDLWGPGQVMDDGAGGAAAVLRAARDFYYAYIDAGEAVGIALGVKNSGIGNGMTEVNSAIIRRSSNGRILIRHGWTEMGQGINTVAVQIASSRLQVPPDRFDIEVDTDGELCTGQTTASRATVLLVGALAEACSQAVRDGLRENIDYFGTYELPRTYASEDVGPGRPLHSAFSYSCQIVTIDRVTRRIGRVLAVHDVGKVLNLAACRGQVEGAVHMGLGYSLSEEYPCDQDGLPTVRDIRGLGILPADRTPPIDVVLIEVPQPGVALGIKGVGESGLIATAGAVAGALRSLDGRYRAHLPMRD